MGDGAVRAVGSAVFEVRLAVAHALHGADDERVGVLGEYVRAVKDELTRAAFALTADEFEPLFLLRKRRLDIDHPATSCSKSAGTAEGAYSSGFAAWMHLYTMSLSRTRMPTVTAML